MDIVQAFVLDLGWIFFIAWGTVLAAVGAIAFGRDLFPSTSRRRYEPGTSFPPRRLIRLCGDERQINIA